MGVLGQLLVRLVEVLLVLPGFRGEGLGRQWSAAGGAVFGRREEAADVRHLMPVDILRESEGVNEALCCGFGFRVWAIVHYLLRELLERLGEVREELLLVLPERESSLLTTYWSESTLSS